MWLPFYLQNLHFAIHLLAALVLFAVFWLYFDSWQNRKLKRELPRLLGLLILSASFILSAVSVPDLNLTGQLTFLESAGIWLRLTGFALLLYGLYRIPLQDRPQNQATASFAWLPGLPAIIIPLAWITTVALAFGSAYFYFRQATTGLERHLKRLGLAFSLLGLAELFAGARFLDTTTNLALFELAAPYRLFWGLSHLFLLLALVFMGRWVWQYLLLRFQSQLFMVFTLMVLFVFLITTVIFTSILTRNLERQVNLRLSADAKVLKYAFDQKQQAVLSDAQLLANHPALNQAIIDNQTALISETAHSLLTAKGYLNALIVNQDYRVIGAADDELIGQSLSSNLLLQRAVAGESWSATAIEPGPLGEEVWIQAAVPVKSEATIIGVVLLGELIDNAFVDGIKQSTGMEAALYAGDYLSASSYIDSQEERRWLGTRLTNQAIRRQVLEMGETYVGEINMLNRPYAAALEPLPDAVGVPVGILFVGAPQTLVMESVRQSLNLTFLVAALMMVASLLPAFLVARYITYQVR